MVRILSRMYLGPCACTESLVIMASRGRFKGRFLKKGRNSFNRAHCIGKLNGTQKNYHKLKVQMHEHVEMTDKAATLIIDVYLFLSRLGVARSRVGDHYPV